MLQSQQQRALCRLPILLRTLTPATFGITRSSGIGVIPTKTPQPSIRCNRNNPQNRYG